MTEINQLTRSTSVSAGDLLPLFATTNGDARAAAVSVLQSYLQANLSFAAGSFTTQYAAPNASAFNVTITDGSTDGVTQDNVHLILTPTGGFAAGTITLPPKANLVDKQQVLVNCTQAVTTLTVAGNGAGAVIGAPTTLAANAFFRLKYDALSTNWYRVG